MQNSTLSGIQQLAVTLFLVFSFTFYSSSQEITVDPNQLVGPASHLNQPGVFLVPKTTEGETVFLNNGVQFNSIRLISIESAFDYSSPSINDIMATLELLKPGILYANSRCEKLILPIMKMPLWLSSSTDTTTIGGGWKTFNGMPPANYTTWNTLVDSIVNKINNQWGLDPYYEIWNEPDIFYWQGTTDDYYTFFKNTYFAIKNNHPTAKVGGPVVSSFTSKFTGTYIPGFISNTELDSSIIGTLIDSCVNWNAHLDFISWHKFDSYLHTVDMEITYLNQKLINSGHGIVPYIVSEWNNTSSLRESSVAAAFMPNYVQALENYAINGHVVAAWQDFEMDTFEFHKDYGLISWYGLEKPEWKALLLLHKLKGQKIVNSSSDYRNLTVESNIDEDTLRVLFSNFSMSGFIEATSHLMFDNQYNALDLILAGYTTTKLDSIYKGFITITGTDSLTMAINSVIPIYQHADSVLQFGRDIDLKFNGLNGIHQGKIYEINSIENNCIYTYDSLINSGYDRITATSLIYPNSNNSFEVFSLTDSIHTFHMDPNSIYLVELHIPELSISNYQKEDFNLYPNPVHNDLNIVSKEAIKSITIIDLTGQELIVSNVQKVNVSQLPNGIYFAKITTVNGGTWVYKFVKE